MKVCTSQGNIHQGASFQSTEKYETTKTPQDIEVTEEYHVLNQISPLKSI